MNLKTCRSRTINATPPSRRPWRSDLSMSLTEPKNSRATVTAEPASSQQNSPPHQTKPEVVLVVAYSRNRVIGRNNSLPWRLPSDLAHFKRTTMGHPIVMGRRTWESLPRALPGRENIVVTRQHNFEVPGGTVVHSLQAALEHAVRNGASVVCVIGGAEIFELALPLADRIVATE